MTCEQLTHILDSYVDGEFVDPVRVAEIEAHLDSCPACRLHLEALRKVKQMVRAEGRYFPAPESLVASIEAIGRPSAPRLRWRRTLWPAVGLGGFSVAALIFLAFFFNRGPAPVAAVEPELVAAHVRSLQANHLYDVVSTDQHTVKPWFQGKLDFSPEVPNLASDGFPLLGGRLDYVQKHPAAALVYGHSKHKINVFVIPGYCGSMPPIPTDQEGFHIVRWGEHELQYWAVSDIDAGSLQSFAELFVKATVR